MTVEKRAMAFYIVRCDRCGREHKLGTELEVAKLAQAVRVFTHVSGFDDDAAAQLLAFLAGFPRVVGGDHAHLCAVCTEIREAKEAVRVDNFQR